MFFIIIFVTTFLFGFKLLTFSVYYSSLLCDVEKYTPPVILLMVSYMVFGFTSSLTICFVFSKTPLFVLIHGLVKKLSFAVFPWGKTGVDSLTVDSAW